MRNSWMTFLQKSQPYRILVVEDVAENCQLLLQLLQNVGFLVRTAENGSDAVKLWQAWQPHLILMDIIMPIMDGCEATRQIRDRERQIGNSQSSTPILAITANVFDEDRNAIFAAGCDDIINKPLEEKNLWQKLALYLQLPEIDRPIELESSSIGNSFDLRLDREQLSLMPLDWQEQFERACLEINYEKMRELIAQIPPTAAIFADRLDRLIENYRVDIILDWLQSNKIQS